MDILWTPTLNNAQKQALFRIVCNVWAKQEDSLTIMTIWAMNGLGSGHVQPNGLEDVL